MRNKARKGVLGGGTLPFFNNLCRGRDFLLCHEWQGFHPVDMMKMYETKEYSVFKKMVGNRPVDRRRVETLCKAIDKKNLLSIRPILVNERMEVVDGQHRLEAAKLLKVPIAYVVVDGADFEEASVLNANTKTWGCEDFVKMYAAQGFPDYKALLGLYETIGLPFSTILEYYSPRCHRSNGEFYAAIRNGECPFEVVSATEFFEFYKRVVGDFKERSLLAKYKLSFLTTRTFVRGFLEFYKKHKGSFSEDILLDHMLVKSGSVVRKSAGREYYKLLVDLYNFGLGNSNRLKSVT